MMSAMVELLMEHDRPSRTTCSGSDPGPSAGRLSALEARGADVEELRAAGWPLVSVPYWQWDELKTAEAKRAYLSRVLNEGG